MGQLAQFMWIFPIKLGVGNYIYLMTNYKVLFLGLSKLLLFFSSLEKKSNELFKVKIKVYVIKGIAITLHLFVTVGYSCVL